MCENSIPSLRFPEFSFAWKTDKISNTILDFRLGGNYQNSLIFNQYPLIKMGNLSRSYFNTKKVEYISNIENLNDEDKIKFGDLFFNTRNTLELVGKVAVWRNELDVAYYNSNLLRLKFENNFFFNYLFNSFNGIKSLRRIASGTTSVAAIYTKDLLNLKVSYPSDYKEQKKIADFLSSVDKKISLLKEKHTLLEQYKKGVMQKLFSQEIRFKDEDGNDFPDWKQSKLGEHLVEYKERSQKENEHEVLTSSRTGLMKQSDYYSEGRITERSNKGFNVIPENHITFRSRSDDRKFFFNLNTLGLTGIISTYYPVFKMKNEQNSFFIELTRYHKNVFGKYAVGTSQVVLSMTEFLKIKLEFPCTEEQKKISDFARELDKKLELVNQQIEQNQTFKKGLLQQMFV